MNRTLAIVERELRKFFRSPALMFISMIFPLVQLIVLGNAFGGKVRDARIAVVDHDHGPQALRVKQALDAIYQNARTFRYVEYADEKTAVDDVRNSRIQGALIIPPEFSRKMYVGANPRIGLVVDNTDTFMSSTLEDRLGQVAAALSRPQIEPRLVQQLSLDIVELYPYVDYMRYLLPGSIVLAVFVSVMVGGGIVYIDDKARGVHEGYLVTPIRKIELVAGLNVAGTLKAIGSGAVLTFIGSLLTGVNVFQASKLALACVMIVCTAFAFVTMISLMMARVEDPLIPRAIFGILNTLLFFPSGSIYPILAFPKWLQALAAVNPFTYAVHGFKSLLLRESGLLAIWPDIAYLLGFGVVMFTGATLLFKRTL